MVQIFKRDRNKRITALFLGIRKPTLAEIGKIYGLTKQTTHEIVQRTLEKYDGKELYRSSGVIHSKTID